MVHRIFRNSPQDSTRKCPEHGNVMDDHIMLYYMVLLILKGGDNPGCSILVTWANESNELSPAGGKRRWWKKTEGLKHEKECTIAGSKMKKTTCKGRQAAPRGREWPRLINSKEMDLNPTTTSNWILPTTWIFSLEIESSPEPPDRSPASWHLISAKPSGAHLHSWLTELWDNKWVLF